MKKKIDCHSRSIYYYDEESAREKLKEYIKEYELLNYTSKYDWEDKEERLEDIIDEIMEDFSDRTGIGSKGYDVLCDLDCDCFEYAYNIGKKDTGILELYMLAFKLAMEQIRGNE